MRLRNTHSARVTHIATVTDIPAGNQSSGRRLTTILAMTAAILTVFFVGRHWATKVLANHWKNSLATVSDDRAEVLVASAARLGRPGIPVLVAALASPRESVSSAGRLWIDRELRSWESQSTVDSQRNVVALAEAMSCELEHFTPATRLEAARFAERMLAWHLDAETVDRERFTWLCDRVLRAADYKVVARRREISDPSPNAVEADQAGSDDPLASADRMAVPGRLEIPESPQEIEPRPRFGAQLGAGVQANVVPLPKVGENSRSSDLADAWAMRSRRLGDLRSSELNAYPSTSDRVLVPPASETPSQASETAGPLSQLSLSECMQRLHAPGLESLAAEEELKRRGFDAIRLSIARRVCDPDRHVRLKLVRELPGIPNIGASEWLIKMAADEDEEVRLAAISLLATTNDPNILDRVEAIARNDSAERIRVQAERVKKRRQTLRRL